MKIVVLEASHDKKGMTMLLVRRLLDGIKSVDAKAKIISYDLLNEDIKFCRGCNSCTEDKDPVNAKCSVDDICDKIKKDALDCDILVFASPIYEYAVSSSMKRFLERCLTLVTFRFGPVARAKPLKGKQGIVLCPSGAPFPFNHLMGITRYPRFMLKLACRLFRCSSVEFLFAGGMRISKSYQDRWSRKAFALGEKAAKKAARTH